MVSPLNNLFPGLADTRVSGSDGPNGRQDTASLFSQGLKRGLGVDVPPSPANDPGNKVFDVQAVVDTVSGFIEQRIDQRRAEGASQDELDDLISQAREGVSRGFQLAREDIEALDRLSTELSDNINAAEQGINSRIDQIEENLASGDEGIVTSLSNTAISDFRSLERSAASFQFELTTQEGDRIQVSAQELFERREQFTSVQGDGTSASRFDSSTASASAFSINVQGDLNDQERAALDNLLVQVADISDSFFSGGVEDAFNQALSLNFDGSQIAEFSLDLRSSSLTAVQQTDIRTGLQNAGIPDDYRTPQIPLGLQTVLSDFANQVEKLLDSARDFSDELNLIDTGESLARTLQREFDQSLGRGGDAAQNDFFDALLEELV